MHPYPGWSYVIQLSCDCWPTMTHVLFLSSEKGISLFMLASHPSFLAYMLFLSSWKTSLCSIQTFSSSFQRFFVLFQQVIAFQISSPRFPLSVISLFSIPVLALFVCYIFILCIGVVLLTRSIGINELTDLIFYSKTLEKGWYFFFCYEEREAILEFIGLVLSP